MNRESEQQNATRADGIEATYQPHISADDPRLALLRDQLAFHREEAKHKSESQRTIARTAIVGVAAVATLRQDIEWHQVRELLPFAPLLVMALFAYWTAETAFVYRFGRWNAHLEYQINQLLSARVLTHEMKLWQSRKRIFGQSVWTYGLVGSVITAVHVGCTIALNETTFHNREPALATAVLLAAIAVNALWLVYLFRLFVQFADETLERHIAESFARIP